MKSDRWYAWHYQSQMQLMQTTGAGIIKQTANRGRARPQRRKFKFDDGEVLRARSVATRYVNRDFLPPGDVQIPDVVTNPVFRSSVWRYSRTSATDADSGEYIPEASPNVSVDHVGIMAIACFSSW